MSAIKILFLFFFLLLTKEQVFAVVHARQQVVSAEAMQWADSRTERTWKERRLDRKKQKLIAQLNRLENARQEDSRPDGINKWLILAGILALAAILFELLPVFSWFAGLFALGAVICLIVWVVKFIG